MSPLERALLLILATLLTPINTVIAAPPTTAQQLDEIQRREQERSQKELEQLRQAPALPSGLDTRAQVPESKKSATGELCRDIERVDIDGANLLSQTELRAVRQAYTGRCLSVNDIEALLGALTQYYLQKGYVTTRAYLPGQDLNDKQLLVRVIEGRLGSIDVQDGEQGSVSIANVFPSAEGAVLNLRDIEQGLDQINRLASNNATMDIEPAQAPGVSKLLVRNQLSSPLHAYFSMDNQGSQSTGQDQVALSVYADNPGGMNDQVGLSHRESSFGDKRGQRSQSNSLSYSLPYGYWTFSYGLNYSSYESTVELPSGAQARADGANRSQNLAASYVAFRDHNTRLTLNTSLTNKSSRNYFQGQLLSVSSRELSILDVDLNYSLNSDAGFWWATIGYARGTHLMGALDDLGSLPTSAPKAQFQKYKYALSYNRLFVLAGLPFSVSSRLNGQESEDTLFGSERILVGSLYSVRGFSSGSLSGDDGLYIRNELAYEPVAQIGGGIFRSKYFVGIDYGKVKGKHDNAGDGELSGLTLGAQWRWRGLVLDIYNSRPLSVPRILQREGSRTWMELSYAF